MTDPKLIHAALTARPVAVVGASNDRTKYGNIVLRDLRERGWTVYAVNPRGGEIEGEPSFTSLGGCPVKPQLAVVVTPPAVTLKVVAEASQLGVDYVWLQPGAESDEVVAEAQRLNQPLIYDACIMVLAPRGGAGTA